MTPALNSPLRHWVSDEDGARAAAADRLEASLEAMRAAGMKARGEIGDSDPVQAIDDALRTFAPDDIVISTHPEGRSNWLERGVVDAARERFDVPITHVVVDLDADRADAPAEASARAAARDLHGARRNLAVGLRRAQTDVDRDVLRVLAVGQVRRHAGNAGARLRVRVGDLPADEVRDGRLVEALLLVGAKASSRFGPTVPWVLALARVWQAPHFCTKSALPFDGSPEVTRCDGAAAGRDQRRWRASSGDGCPARAPAHRRYTVT